jgi:hypothetical protein
MGFILLRLEVEARHSFGFPDVLGQRGDVKES